MLVIYQTEAACALRDTLCGGNVTARGQAGQLALHTAITGALQGWMGVSLGAVHPQPLSPCALGPRGRGSCPEGADVCRERFP